MLAQLVRDSLMQVPEGEVRPDLDDAVCTYVVDVAAVTADDAPEVGEVGYLAEIGAELAGKLAAAPGYLPVTAVVAGLAGKLRGALRGE